MGVLYKPLITFLKLDKIYANNFTTNYIKLNDIKWLLLDVCRLCRFDDFTVKHNQNTGVGGLKINIDENNCNVEISAHIMSISKKQRYRRLRLRVTETSSSHMAPIILSRLCDYIYAQETSTD